MNMIDEKKDIRERQLELFCFLFTDNLSKWK